MEARVNRLIPDGIPRYVRCYDNGGKTLDRYTVVFTGNYNNIGRKTRERRRSSFIYWGMSENPFHGIGQHGESNFIIDRPAYSHLGKKIAFNQLPELCREAALQTYREIWGI